MIKSSIEKLAHEIGYEIGTSDDVTQANLINSFCEGLSNSILDNRNLEMQVCYIVEKLSSKSVSIINTMHAFVELKENEKR